MMMMMIMIENNKRFISRKEREKKSIWYTYHLKSTLRPTYTTKKKENCLLNFASKNILKIFLLPDTDIGHHHPTLRGKYLMKNHLLHHFLPSNIYQSHSNFCVCRVQSCLLSTTNTKKEGEERIKEKLVIYLHDLAKN